MSCSDIGGFGYVEIEGDRLKVVDGDPSSPTIKYFCSCNIVKAVKDNDIIIQHGYKDANDLLNSISKERQEVIRLEIQVNNLKSTIATMEYDRNYSQ